LKSCRKWFSRMIFLEVLYSGNAAATCHRLSGNVSQCTASRGLDGLSALPRRLDGKVSRFFERCSSSISTTGYREARAHLSFLYCSLNTPRCVDTLMSFEHSPLNPSRLSVQRAIALPWRSVSNTRRFVCAPGKSHSTITPNCKLANQPVKINNNVVRYLLRKTKKATQHESPNGSPNLLLLADSRKRAGLPFKPFALKESCVLVFSKLHGFRDLEVNDTAEFFRHVPIVGEKSTRNNVEGLELLTGKQNALKRKVDGTLLLVDEQLANLRRTVSPYDTILSHDASSGCIRVRARQVVTHRARPLCFYRRILGEVQEKRLREAA